MERAAFVALLLAASLEGEVRDLRATELQEVIELRMLLARPIQSLPRTSVPGRATQTPPGWASRKAATNLLAYAPHSGSGGPAPDPPAVLWALRHIEEFRLIESSWRHSLSQLEKGLWMGMFEGHGDALRHRGAEAARVAECRRQRVELARAVASGEALKGLVDTEAAQRQFLSYDELSEFDELRGRTSRRHLVLDTSAFHRGVRDALTAQQSALVDRIVEVEYRAPFWEPPTLDVADGDFVRWCEEAEELDRAAIEREERNDFEDEESRDRSTNGSECPEEDDELTRLPTHAPAYHHTNCGEAFGDCVGEL